MSRKFSIALILLGTAVSGSLLSLHFYLLERQHDELFSASRPVFSTTIEQKMEMMDYSLRALESYMLEDWSLNRFENVLEIVKGEKQVRESLQELAYSQKKQTGDAYHTDDLIELKQRMKQELTQLQNEIVELLREKSEVYDLSDWQLDELTKTIAMVGTTDFSLSLPVAGHSCSIQRDLLFLYFLNSQEAMLDALLQIVGSKADPIDVYFPIISAKPQYVRLGDTLTTQISIGGNPRHLAHARLELTIGTDTISIEPNGLATYKFVPSRKGHHSLPYHLTVTNLHINESSHSEGNYEFIVF